MGLGALVAAGAFVGYVVSRTVGIRHTAGRVDGADRHPLPCGRGPFRDALRLRGPGPKDPPRVEARGRQEPEVGEMRAQASSSGSRYSYDEVVARVVQHSDRA